MGVKTDLKSKNQGCSSILKVMSQKIIVQFFSSITKKLKTLKNSEKIVSMLTPSSTDKDSLCGLPAQYLSMTLANFMWQVAPTHLPCIF